MKIRLFLVLSIITLFSLSIYVQNISADNVLFYEDVRITQFFGGNTPILRITIISPTINDLDLMLVWNDSGGPHYRYFEKLQDYPGNKTQFLLLIALNSSYNQQQFPYDNYKFVGYLGANYSLDSTIIPLAPLSFDFPNYMGYWEASYLGDFDKLLQTMPSLISSEFEDVDFCASWRTFTIQIYHNEGFQQYANFMFNIMTAILVIIALVFLILPLGIFAKQRKSMENHWLDVFDILITFGTGILVFIPIYQLSIQSMKLPATVVPQDTWLIAAFFIVLLDIFITMSIRFYFKRKDDCLKNGINVNSIHLRHSIFKKKNKR